jgi:hypothetical protein
METTQSYRNTMGAVADLVPDDAHLCEVVQAYLWFGDYAWDLWRRVNVELLGFSLRTRQSGSLLTIRAVVEGERKVSFISGVTITDCLRIAHRQAVNDELRWSPDKFA